MFILYATNKGDNNHKHQTTICLFIQMIDFILINNPNPYFKILTHNNVIEFEKFDVHRFSLIKIFILNKILRIYEILCVLTLFLNLWFI